MSERDKEISRFIVFLLEHVGDLQAQTAALRALLMSRGLFSLEEYERSRAEALSEWRTLLTNVLQRNFDQANDAYLRQLLEKHDGSRNQEN